MQTGLLAPVAHSRSTKPMALQVNFRVSEVDR
jgi:hypothetical protein